MSGFPVIVEGEGGKALRLEAPPRRIVSLAPSHTETLYALGVGERVVAVDTYSDYPPEAKPKATLQCWPRPPAEQLVALKPDLIVVLTQGEEFSSQMGAAGIPVLRLFAENWIEVLEDIRTLGRAVGAPDGAEEIVKEMEARAAAVEKRVAGLQRPRVLFELDASDPTRPYVAGNGGSYGHLLELAGGVNAFRDLKESAVQVSAEQILARDPEVILLGDTRSPQSPQNPEMVAARSGWKGIAAVRTRRMYPVDSDRITRPGPRLVDGLEEIARILHPERFE